MEPKDDPVETASASKPNAARAATMADVGRIAGVSQVTVSRALSDPSKVSQKTLKKITEAIEITGFVPNAIAGALASRRSKLIAALVPSIVNIVYASMIQSFTETMRDHGYQILLSETGTDLVTEEALITTHLSRRPDAMLLTGIHHTANARKMLLGADIPIVEVWDMTDTPIDLCVGFSHQDAARAVADFAFNAGYVTAGTVSAGDERALRRKSAFSDQFTSLSGHPVAQVNFDGPATLERGRIGLRDLLDKQKIQNGVIFCSSDLLAHGILIEAQARGLKVPEQIAVIGFGDQDFAAHTEPSLTTVRVDRTALGFSAADAILSRLRDGKAKAPVTNLGFEIVRRRSA